MEEVQLYYVLDQQVLPLPREYRFDAESVYLLRQGIHLRVVPATEEGGAWLREHQLDFDKDHEQLVFPLSLDAQRRAHAGRQAQFVCVPPGGLPFERATRRDERTPPPPTHRTGEAQKPPKPEPPGPKGQPPLRLA
jgi:virulence-associated protein VagC